MKRIGPWTVGEYGIRPAGSPDHCFYCGVERGGIHLEKCVIRERTIVVQFTVELVVVEPESFGPDLINFKYNEGSWCADNLADMMAKAVERIGDNGCLCPVVSGEYVREATGDDERDQQLFAEMAPN